MKKTDRKMVAVNKRAGYDYEFIEKFEAGLVLTGTEVKSLRNGKASLGEAYGRVDRGELYLHGLDIAPYSHCAGGGHEPKRKRKLLLHRKELSKIAPLVIQRGFTLVPTRLYFRHGWAKIEIAVGRGKQKYDKRQALLKKDHERQMQRAVREDR